RISVLPVPGGPTSNTARDDAMATSTMRSTRAASCNSTTRDTCRRADAASRRRYRSYASSPSNAATRSASKEPVSANGLLNSDPPAAQVQSDPPQHLEMLAAVLEESIDGHALD